MSRSTSPPLGGEARAAFTGGGQSLAPDLPEPSEKKDTILERGSRSEFFIENDVPEHLFDTLRRPDMEREALDY
jgi:hypothetical protein